MQKVERKLKRREKTPYFELWFLPLVEQAEPPKFRDHARCPECDGKGVTLYYTAGCPFTGKYVPLLEKWTGERDIPLTAVKIDS